MPIRGGEVRRVRVPPPNTWNTRDPIVQMQPQDALILDDLMPETDGLSIRPGYSQHISLTGDWVTSLMRWFTQDGERLISVIQNLPGYVMQDITTGTATTLATTMGGYWRHAQLANVLGLVNGADKAQTLTWSGGSVVRKDMTVTGIASDRLSRISIFKSRSYFATGDEPAFWYSEVNSLGGALTKFPIDRVTNTGGNVIELSSWTRDGGSGPDDFFVLFLDSGEVVVYQGSNPGDASDWALVGLYSLGDVKATTRFGGKLHVVSGFDYNIIPDDLLTSGFRQATKLSGAARDSVKNVGGVWQILVDPSRGWRIINVPKETKEQHILNLRTGGICRTHYPASVWQIFNGELFFGGDGAVYKVGGADDNGSAITWSMLQAYIDTGKDSWVERYRTIWTSPGDFTYESGISYDYDAPEFLQSISTTTEGSPWDTSTWDVSSWSVGGTTKNEWQLGLGRGTAVSLMMNGSSTTGGTYHGADFEVR